MALPKEKKKRQSGDLRSLHIRIPEYKYKTIVEMCDKLEITQAQFFTDMLEDDGYCKLVDRADRIMSKPVQYTLEMSDECRKTIDGLTAKLADTNRQMQSIGTNISTLIRDIRTGKVDVRNCEKELSEISKTVSEMQEEYHSIGATLLFDLLQSGEAPEVKKQAVEEPDRYNNWRTKLIMETREKHGLKPLR